MTAARPTDEMNSWLGKLDSSLAPILPAPNKPAPSTPAPSAVKATSTDANKVASSKLAGIQKALQKLGYDPGKIDGIMGPNTQAALKKFQRANGLTADGILGPKTQAALAKALQGGAATATAKSVPATAKAGHGSTTSSPTAAASKAQPPAAAQAKPAAKAAPGAPMPKDAILEGVMEIQNQLTDIRTKIGVFWQNYHDGLQAFDRKMIEGAIDSLKPEQVGFLRKLFNDGLKEGISKFIKALPGGEVLDLVTKALEPEAVAAPSGMQSAADYVNDILKSYGSARDKMLDNFKAAGSPFEQSFRALAASDAGKATGFLTLLRMTAGAFKQLPNVCSANFFEAQFALKFSAVGGKTADKTFNATGEDLVVEKGRDSGTLYFRIYLLMETDGGKHKFEVRSKTSRQWKLVRRGDKAEAVGAAKALHDSAGMPWRMPLPRKVQVNIMEQVGPVSKELASAWLVFKPGSGNIDAFEELEGDKELLKEAWASNPVRGEATGNSDLEGDNE